MRGHRHTVLIVDDEGAERDAVRDRLVAMGMEVLAARHGRAALQIISLGIRPCVILIDVVKAGVAGNELRRALQYDPGLRSIPVVVLPEAPARHGNATEAVDVQALLAASGMLCLELLGFRRPPTPRAPRATALRPERHPNGRRGRSP
jgi:CheY-like chemotaxis protein